MCMESRRMVLLGVVTGQLWRHRHRGKTYGHGAGRRRGWDVVRVAWMRVWTASRGILALWLRELTRGLWSNLEGWEWVGGGREAQGRGDIRTARINSCRCTTEMKPILETNHQSIKYFLKRQKKERKNTSSDSKCFWGLQYPSTSLYIDSISFWEFDIETPN